MGLGPLKALVSDGAGSTVRRFLLLPYSHDLCPALTIASQPCGADHAPAPVWAQTSPLLGRAAQLVNQSWGSTLLRVVTLA